MSISRWWRRCARRRGPRQRDAVLSGRAERVGAVALVEDNRSLQRAGREPAVEAVSFRGRSAGRRRAGGASAHRSRAAGAHARVSGSAFWAWSCGGDWSWMVSLRRCWTGRKMRPRCRGRRWPRCWPSTGCVRRAANWPSNSAGFLPPRWMICWASRRRRSTTRACIAAWIACCRTRRALEQHLKQRYGELFAAQFDVLLYDLTSSYVEGV